MALLTVQAKPAQAVTANQFSEPTNPPVQSVDTDAVGRQIQTRYGEAPGVIPLGSNSFLNRRLAHLTVDPVPLLHQLQQRWLAAGDPSADVGIEMPYTHRLAGNEAATELGEAGPAYPPAYSTAAPETLPAAASAQGGGQTNSSTNTMVARQSLPPPVAAVKANPSPEPPASHTNWGASILRRHLAQTASHSEPTVSVDPSKGSLPRRLVARALAANEPLASQESTSGQPQAALASPRQTKSLPLPQAAALPGEKLANGRADSNTPGAPVIQPDKSVIGPPVAPSVYRQRTQDTGEAKNIVANMMTSAPVQPVARAPIVQRAQPAVGASGEPGSSATARTLARSLETSASPTGDSTPVIGTPIVQRRRGGASPVRLPEAGQGSPLQEQPLVRTPTQPFGNLSKALPTSPSAQAASSAPKPTATFSTGHIQAASVLEPNRSTLAPQTLVTPQTAMTSQISSGVSSQDASPITQTTEPRMELVQRHWTNDTHQTAQSVRATASLQALPIESAQAPVMASGGLVQKTAESASTRQDNVHRSVPVTPEVITPNSLPALEPLQKMAAESDNFVKEASAKTTHASDNLQRSVQTKSEGGTPGLAQPISPPLVASQKFLERAGAEKLGQQPSAAAIAPSFELARKGSVYKALDASVQPEMPLTLPTVGMAQRTVSSGENRPSVTHAQTTARANEQEHGPHEMSDASGAVVPAPAYPNLAPIPIAQQTLPVTGAAQSAPAVALSSAPISMPVRRPSTNIAPNEPGQAVLQRRSEGATSQRTQAATEIRSPSSTSASAGYNGTPRPAMLTHTNLPSLASASAGYNGLPREDLAPTAPESMPQTSEEPSALPLVQRALPLQEQPTTPDARPVQAHPLPVIIPRTVTPLVARSAEQAVAASKGEGVPVLPLVHELQPKATASDQRPWLNDSPVSALGATFVQRLINGPTEPLVQRWSSAASGNWGGANARTEPLTWLAPASLIQRALAATLPDRTLTSDSGGAIQRQEEVQALMRQSSPASSSTPAASTATQASLTSALANMTTPIAPATGVARQNLDNIDFERLADRVYAIIEQRLIRERESLGL